MGEFTDFMNELRFLYANYCETVKYDNPAVSIIVPAYNVENYIESAVDFQSKKPTRVALVGLPVNGLIT